MKRIRQVLLIVMLVYALYLTKTALGIDISHRYHAADVFKFPLRAIERVLGA